VDGSTLEALFRKLNALTDRPAGALAGKLCTVIDLASRLREQIWYGEEAQKTTFLDPTHARRHPHSSCRLGGSDGQAQPAAKHI
jgi:hypothetical protein